MESLPNLHPALVHYPIALLPLAVLIDLIASVVRRRTGGERTAWTLGGVSAMVYALAALGALVAYLSGQQAKEEAGTVAAPVELALHDHENAALAALLALALLAVFRSIAAWRAARGARTVPPAIFVALALPALALVMRTGNLGGALVYRHGIGVARDAAMAPGTAAAPDPGVAPPGLETPMHTPSAAETWTLAASDTGFLGTVLLPSPESAHVTAVRGAGGRGLALRVAGRSVLLLPGAYGDARFSAEIERAGFSGTVALVMRARLPVHATIFQVGAASAELVAVSHGASRVLAAGPGTRAGELSMTLAAEGGRWRGEIAGVPVVEGAHETPPGNVGLVLDGTGVVRIRSLEVTPSR